MSDHSAQVGTEKLSDTVTGPNEEQIISQSQKPAHVRNRLSSNRRNLHKWGTENFTGAETCDARTNDNHGQTDEPTDGQTRSSQGTKHK